MNRKYLIAGSLLLIIVSVGIAFQFAGNAKYAQINYRVADSQTTVTAQDIGTYDKIYITTNTGKITKCASMIKDTSKFKNGCILVQSGDSAVISYEKSTTETVRFTVWVSENGNLRKYKSYSIST